MDDTFIGTCIFCFLLVTASAADISNDDLSERLELLEQHYARDLILLEERMEQRYASKIGHLEERVVKLEATNKQLVEENEINKAEIVTLRKQIAECKTWKSDWDENNSVDVVEGKGYTYRVEQSKRKTVDDVHRIINTERATQNRKYVNNDRKRALVEGTNIAFTSYNDHDLNNQGLNQVVVFNKVLLNHGNAYNNFSGTFTAPMAGVYSFTFVIGERDVNEFRASLVVNNQHMVDAVTQTVHAGHDLQGGNTANLMLHQGDIVFVRHLSTGPHLEGSDSFRVSTFSGFLIYPVEAPSSIVGK